MVEFSCLLFLNNLQTKKNELWIQRQIISDVCETKLPSQYVHTSSAHVEILTERQFMWFLCVWHNWWLDTGLSDSQLKALTARPQCYPEQLMYNHAEIQQKTTRVITNYFDKTDKEQCSRNVVCMIVSPHASIFSVIALSIASSIFFIWLFPSKS